MEIKKIITDVIEQFKSGENTNALCNAIDKQISDLMAACDQVQLLTNIDAAEGKQLDNIGDILCLTRSQAALLCGDTIFFEEMTDEPYRRYLKYKAIRDASDCTYYSLISSLKAILGEDASIVYSEDADYPATILLDITPNNDDKVYLDAIPPIKSAGVTVRYITSYGTTIEIAHDLTHYKSEILCGTHYCGTWPENIKTEE